MVFQQQIASARSVFQLVMQAGLLLLFSFPFLRSFTSAAALCTHAAVKRRLSQSVSCRSPRIPRQISGVCESWQLQDGSPRPPEATRPSQEPLTCVAHKFQPSQRAKQTLSRLRNHIWSLPEACCDILNVIAHNNSMINRTEIWCFVAAGYIEVVLCSMCSMLWLSEAVPALCHVLIDQWEVPHYVCTYVYIYVCVYMGINIYIHIHD